MKPTATPVLPHAARLLRRQIVFVRDLVVEAEVGVYAHERGRRQRLHLHIEAEAEVCVANGLAGTVDYDVLAAAAFDVAARGHYDLIESFAEAIAETCFRIPAIHRIRVKTEKPEALSRYGAVAGFDLQLERVCPSPHRRENARRLAPDESRAAEWERLNHEL